MKSRNQAFRTCLVDVGKEIGKEEAKLLAFEIFDNRSDQTDVENGQDFIRCIHRVHYSTPGDVTNLLNALQRRQLMKAYDIFQVYQRKYLSGTNTVPENEALHNTSAVQSGATETRLSPSDGTSVSIPKEQSKDERLVDSAVSSQGTNEANIGVVVIKQNQCLHLTDQRYHNNEILFICFDATNSQHELWRYSYTLHHHEYPVVLSNRALYYKRHFQLLFAVGKTIYFVDFASYGGYYATVSRIETLQIDAVEEGRRITCIYAHHDAPERRGEFLIAVSGSKVLHRCSKVYDGSFATIDTSPVTPSHVNGISSVSYNGTTFAMIGSDSEEVILFAHDGVVRRQGTLSAPASASALRPLSVFWTGARWLVLWLSKDPMGTWWVMMYKPSEGRMEPVYQKKISSDLDTPVSFTNNIRKVIVSLVNKSVVVFDF